MDVQKGRLGAVLRLFCLYFFLFAASYLLLLCLGTAANHAASRRERQRELQIRQSEAAGLLQDMTGRLRVILNQVSGRDWIEKYAVGDADSAAVQDPYERYQIYTSLKRQQLTFDGVELLGVYFKGLNLVIDQQGVYDSSDYFKSELLLDGVYESQWHAWAEGRSNFSVAALGGAAYQDRWVDGVTVFRTIPNNSIKGKGLVFLTASRRLFSDLLSPMEEAGVSCVLTDMDNRLIASVGEFDPLSLDLLGEEGYPYVLFSETTLGNSSWKLYVVESRDALSLLDSAAPFLSLPSVLSVLLLGLGLAALLTRSDIRRRERLQKRIPSVYVGGLYEGARLYLRDSRAKLEELRRQESADAPLARESQLRALLGMLEQPGAAAPELGENPCVVVALCSPLRRISSFLDRDKLAQELRESLRPLFCRVDAVFDRGNRLALLLWMDTVQQKTGYLEPVERWLSGRFREVYGEEQPVFYGMGEAALRPEEIRECWRIALQDLDYKLLTHGLAIPAEGEAEHTLPDAAFEIALMEWLQQEDLAKLWEQVSLSLSGAGVETVRLFHWKLQAVLLKLAGEECDPEALLRGAFSIGRLLELLPEYARSGEGARAERAACRQQILQYIDSHYRDSELSLQKLKDEFQVSFAMINRTVQEGQGMSFAEYVAGKRLQYARRLLRTTDKPVTELAVLAGYTASGTFIRNFKKYTGLTPGEYRRQHRGEGDTP